MTPKEKAFELYFKYYRDVLANSEKAKQCALIAVDEILSMKIVRKDDLTDEYWENVKQEIEKL